MDYPARTAAQLGPILHSCRKQRGLTQQAAGRKVGLKQATVSALENHSERATLESLYKLLSALDLELVIRERPLGADGEPLRIAENRPEW